MYKIQQYLLTQNITYSQQTTYGRTNSACDETVIKNLLVTNFGNRIRDMPDRHWSDILVYDYLYGWVNPH